MCGATGGTILRSASIYLLCCTRRPPAQTPSGTQNGSWPSRVQGEPCGCGCHAAGEWLLGRHHEVIASPQTGLLRVVLIRGVVPAVLPGMEAVIRLAPIRRQRGHWILQQVLDP